MGAGSALSALTGSQQINAQNRQATEALEVQRARLRMEQDQQRRGNALFDQQAAALNPMRQQLFSALAGRLGLPANAMSFSTARAPAPSAGMTMPRPTAGAAGFAAQQADIDRLRSQLDAIDDLNRRASLSRRVTAPQRSAIEQRLAQLMGVSR